MTALVAVQVVQRLRVADDGLYLYRGILHPDVDDLAFIGCGVDTLNSLQTAGLQARWLASLLQGSLHLPSRAVQHADLTAQQVWRRSFFPAAHNRAARYAQYTVDYHAQLTRDMSCSSGQQLK
ncbi:putative flavin-containing monooxygenase 1 [Haematococcus lacustris]|uniref:Putative flavin-containing monooxygenase 1 n=1 Tax=Haematococcus lacustris TaxID=44745 RepID=A0A699ZK50_HAELA|nr:putative flavin-containing monooxygenase 1 [Haematococcus lacustris]